MDIMNLNHEQFQNILYRLCSLDTAQLSNLKKSREYNHLVDNNAFEFPKLPAVKHFLTHLRPAVTGQLVQLLCERLAEGGEVARLGRRARHVQDEHVHGRLGRAAK